LIVILLFHSVKSNTIYYRPGDSFDVRHSSFKNNIINIENIIFSQVATKRRFYKKNIFFILIVVLGFYLFWITTYNFVSSSKTEYFSEYFDT